MKSLSNLKDVGIVQVKVMRAEGLMAADVNGNLNISLICLIYLMHPECNVIVHTKTNLRGLSPHLSPVVHKTSPSFMSQKYLENCFTIYV